MAKLSTYPEDTALADEDYLIGVDVASGATKKFPVSLLRSAFLAEGQTARPLIAASDAPDEVRAVATYLCDGVNDEVQILLAISENDGVIDMSSGHFYCSASVAYAKHNVILQGQGIGNTIIESTAASFDLIAIGDRQDDGIMRNFNQLRDMTVTHAGGASTKACIRIDGGGRGSGLHNVQTNEGAYGIELIDLDRCYFTNLDVNNVRNTGILCETGQENTWGTVTWINPSVALSDASSICMRFDTLPAQASPNRFDRLNIIGGLFFSTSGVAGTVGLKMVVGATAFKIMGSLFESPKQAHILLQGETQIELDSISMIQNSGVTTNGFQLEANNHQITIRSGRFQQCTNLFNGVSGFSKITFEGQSTNQGNITNLFTGQFGAKFGTDVDFAGDEALVSGSDSNRFAKVQTRELILKQNATAPDTASGKSGLWYSSNDDMHHLKDENGNDNVLFPRGVVAVTAGASLATDALKGNVFRCTVDQDFTLANPTNLKNGMFIMWELIQNGTGGWDPTLGGKFEFTDAVPDMAGFDTTAGARNLLLGYYNSTADKIFLLALVVT